MAELTDDEMRLLPSSEARALAELHLLHDDLAHAVQAIRLLVDLFGAREFTEAEQTIRLSLYRDALVQFTACFDGTTPLFLRVPDVYPGDPNAPSYFESLKALRDTFAAHRGGPSRQCAVGVIAGPSGPLGIGHLKVRLHVPELLELKYTHDFILKAKKHVQQRRDDLEKHVRIAAMAMSKEEILALPGAHGYNVLPNEMRLGRERFVRKRASQNKQKG
jgi:hypothetical protein